MIRSADLSFYRPTALQASEPPEIRGSARDDVRLLVSTLQGHHHTHFRRLVEHLEPGDLLVVNRSATLAASLPASGGVGDFIVNLSTRYAHNLWLVEPRWSHHRPGPLPLEAGDTVTVAGLEAHLVAPHPGLERLWFMHFRGNLAAAMERFGSPIRYGYLESSYPLAAYQTVFADTPGSAEMPSAGRPFSRAVLASLAARGVAVAAVTLHTGVSSLEVEVADLAELVMPAEPFEVPAKTAAAVTATRAAGGRVIAVGTTVVRALESAWDGTMVRPTRGFTRRFIRPGACGCLLDGLLTGLHDPLATHLAMLYALASRELVREGYSQAVARGYLWHEFGDSHLLLFRD